MALPSRSPRSSGAKGSGSTWVLSTGQRPGGGSGPTSPFARRRRWSRPGLSGMLTQGGTNAARGPWSTASARSPNRRVAYVDVLALKRRTIQFARVPAWRGLRGRWQGQPSSHRAHGVRCDVTGEIVGPRPEGQGGDGPRCLPLCRPAQLPSTSMPTLDPRHQCRRAASSRWSPLLWRGRAAPHGESAPRRPGSTSSIRRRSTSSCSAITVPRPPSQSDGRCRFACRSFCQACPERDSNPHALSDRGF